MYRTTFKYTLSYNHMYESLLKSICALRSRCDQTPRRDVNLGDGRRGALEGNLKEVRVRARRGVRKLKRKPDP